MATGTVDGITARLQKAALEDPEGRGGRTPVLIGVDGDVRSSPEDGSIGIEYDVELSAVVIDTEEV